MQTVLSMTEVSYSTLARRRYVYVAKAIYYAYQVTYTKQLKLLPKLSSLPL